MATAGVMTGLTACVGSPTKPPPSTVTLLPKTSPSGLVYPPARVERAVDGQAGVYYANPYRWLEEKTPEVRDWLRAQARLADGYLKEWPHLQTVVERTAHYRAASVDPLDRMHSYANGKWYLLDVAGSVRVIEVTDLSAAARAQGRVVLDLAQPSVLEALGSKKVVRWLSASPDGKVLALGMTARSDVISIRLLDIESGQFLPRSPKQLLPGNWTGGVQWLPDSSGFYFDGLARGKKSPDHKVFFHQLTPKLRTRAEKVPLPYEASDHTIVNVSDDGRWAVASYGLMQPVPLAVKDRATGDGSGNGKWRTFIDDVDGMVAGYIVGDEYIALTDVGAPRGRIVAIALTSETANDPASWRELVPESDAVIRRINRVGEFFYLHELRDTYAAVRIIDRQGKVVGDMPLPGRGTIVERSLPLQTLLRTGHPDEYHFTFSSFQQSPAHYCHKLRSAELTTVVPPQLRMPELVVEDHWAISDDGTRVPYRLVYRRGLDRNRPQPALFYGYGGFKAPWTPKYLGGLNTFIEAGGMVVFAHLRGGSELGADWWQQGRLQNKHKSYQDLYAIANQLLDQADTSTNLLGITGDSQGGLMAGVAITQRPQLWRVAVAKLPVLDLIGGLRTPYGYLGFKLEYGDPEQAEEMRRVARFSPYQLVKEGSEYPAVYLVASDNDARTPSWHANKFAANLQAASVSKHPILLRAWGRQRSWESRERAALRQEAYAMAFVLQQLGMVPNSPSRSGASQSGF